MIRVLGVGSLDGAREFLERRVGGILRGLARVQSCPALSYTPGTADMVVGYACGEQLRTIKTCDRHVETVAVELELISAGIRALREALADKRVHPPRGGEITVGVVANHQACANYLMAEIVQAGITQPRFISGTLRDAAEIDADILAVSEEISQDLPAHLSCRRVVAIPRAISPRSVGTLLQTVHELAAGQGVDLEAESTYAHGARTKRWHAAPGPTR